MKGQGSGDEKRVEYVHPPVCPDCGAGSMFRLNPPCSLDSRDPHDWHAGEQWNRIHNGPPLESPEVIPTSALSALIEEWEKRAENVGAWPRRDQGPPLLRPRPLPSNRTNLGSNR